MKFNLPINVQEEVKQYDPEVRAMVELQKELEAAKNRSTAKPRKTREYRRGNPAQLVPHDLFSDDPEEGLHAYQDLIKQISDNEDGTKGHAIHRRITDDTGEMIGVIYYYRYLWVAVWIPPKEKDGSRPYVYGISVAFKDTERVRDVVPQAFFAKDGNPMVRMFTHEDMISYTVGRTKYKTKTIYMTEDDIRDGFKGIYWLSLTNTQGWNLLNHNTKTNDVRYHLREFTRKVSATVKHFSGHNDNNGIFDRLCDGDPLLAKAVAGSYNTIAWLARRNIDCYRNEVDWYYEQILSVYVGSLEVKDKLSTFLNNKVMRRYTTEICNKVQQEYELQCSLHEAEFYNLRKIFSDLDYIQANVRNFIEIYPDIPIDYLINNLELFKNTQSICDVQSAAEVGQYLRENVPVATLIKMMNDEMDEDKTQEERGYSRNKNWEGRYLLPQLKDTVDMIQGLLKGDNEVTKPRRWRFKEWHDHIQGLQWKVKNKKEDLPQCLFPEPMKVDSYTFLQPLHTHMLAEWGRAVRNCVGSHGYSDKIKNYQSMILLVMVNREPRYTIQCEVQKGEMTVSQIADVCNRTLDPEARTKVEQMLGEAINKRDQIIKEDKITEQRAKLEAML